MTLGYLKYKYSLIWLQNLQNCEYAKNFIFPQVRSHRKLQFFGFFRKPFKLKKIIIIWHQDNLKVKIHSFGCKICKHVNMQKRHFSTGPQSWKISIFWISPKAFSIEENHHNMTSGYLNCKYSLIWLQNLQKCEYAKNDIFRQFRGHEIFNFFLFFWNPFKLKRTIIIWHQDT